MIWSFREVAPFQLSDRITGSALVALGAAAFIYAVNVKVPIRVIIGEYDVVESEAALRAAFDETYPGADYVIIPGTGHLSPLEATADAIEAIRTAPIV